MGSHTNIVPNTGQYQHPQQQHQNQVNNASSVSCLPSQYQAAAANQGQNRRQSWRKSGGGHSHGNNPNLRATSIHDISSDQTAGGVYTGAKPLETVIDNIISPYNEMSTANQLG